jgi:hypothetical protein
MNRTPLAKAARPSAPPYLPALSGHILVRLIEQRCTHTITALIRLSLAVLLHAVTIARFSRNEAVAAAVSKGNKSEVSSKRHWPDVRPSVADCPLSTFTTTRLFSQITCARAGANTTMSHEHQADHLHRLRGPSYQRHTSQKTRPIPCSKCATFPP